MAFTRGTIDLLVDVHGFEVFHALVFNSDPHPGNVLVAADGQLGLIDYGQCKRLSEQEARALARLIISIHQNEEDDKVCVSGVSVIK